MCISLQIACRRLRALVDSGACRSLMREDTWNDICESRGMDKRLQRLPEGMVHRSLSKEIIPTMGMGKVNKYGIDLIFFVVPRLSHDVLLGDDGLRAMAPNKTYVDNVVKIAGKKHVSVVVGTNSLDFAEVRLDIDKWVVQFPDLFDDGLRGLTQTSSVEIYIDTQGHPPLCLKPYGLSLSKWKIVEQEIAKMLKDDIKPSSSPWSLPMTLVPKPNGEIRFCVDYRKLSYLTKRDPPPPPLTPYSGHLWFHEWCEGLLHPGSSKWVLATTLG